MISFALLLRLRYHLLRDAGNATGNLGREEAKELIAEFYEAADESGFVREEFKRLVRERADALLASNNRVRNAVKSVKPEENPDIVGVYVYSPDQSR